MSHRRSPHTILQILLLAGVSLFCVFAARFVYESPLPLHYAWGSHIESAAAELGIRMVSAEEAKEITDSFTHLVLDARKSAEYQAGRLPAAMSLPVTEFSQYFETVAPLLSEDLPILVYCSGLECDESLELGKILIQSGFTNVTLFAGGMTAWTNAGYAVER